MNRSSSSMGITRHRRDGWRATEDQYILKYVAWRFKYEEMSVLLPLKAPSPRQRSSGAISKRSRSLREKYGLNHENGRLNILNLWLTLSQQGFEDVNLDQTEKEIGNGGRSENPQTGRGFEDVDLDQTEEEIGSGGRNENTQTTGQVFEDEDVIDQKEKEIGSGDSGGRNENAQTG